MKLLTAKQVAELLSVSTRTVWRMLSACELPKPIRFGGRVTRWKSSDIEAWINGQTEGESR